MKIEMKNSHGDEHVQVDAARLALYDRSRATGVK